MLSQPIQTQASEAVQSLLSYASSSGLICSLDAQQYWLIQPQTVAKWKLQQSEDGERWVLVVGGTAQISFATSEALRFLDRRFKPFKPSATPSAITAAKQRRRVLKHPVQA